MEQETDVETLELGVKSAKVASLVAATQIVSIIIGGVMLVLLARLLEPAQYGIYTLAYGVSIFFSAFGLSGIGHYLNRYVPIWIVRKKKEELERDLGASMLVLAEISLGAIVLGVLFSGLISAYVFHNVSYIPLIDLSLLSIIFTLLMFLEYNALIGFKDGIGSAMTFSGGNAGIAVASVGLVLLGYGVMGAIAGLILGSFFGILIGTFYITRHCRIRVEMDDIWERSRRILAFSLPIAGATIIPGLMNSFSILFLGAFSSSVILGSFGIAYRVGTIVLTAVAFVGSVLIQMFASAMERKNSRQVVSKLYNYSIYFGALLAIPITAYLIVFAHAFATSLFPAFKSSVLYTPAVCVSLVIGTIGTYASSLAISAGKVRKVLDYAAITGVVQLALLLLLVPALNAYGVIIAIYFAGSVVSNWLYMRYMEKEMRIKTELGKVYRIIVASTILAIVLFPISLLQISETLQLVIGAVAAIVLYPLMLGVTRAIGKRDVELLNEIGKSTPKLGRLFGYLTSYISIFIR
jgi:O-antigen/teichoic acid export membrane protein